VEKALLAPALAIATTAGTTLFLTYSCSGRWPVLGSDCPREFFGAFHD